MKKNIVSVLIVIFVLFLFGYGAVSAVGPIENPPGTGVSPTFSNLTVNKILTVGATLNLIGSLARAGDLPIEILDAINLSGTIKNPSADLTIDDNLKVNNNLEVAEDISATGNISSDGKISSDIQLYSAQDILAGTNINATSNVVAGGNISAVGNVSGVNGSFSGDISGVNGSFTTSVGSGTGTFGTLNATLVQNLTSSQLTVSDADGLIVSNPSDIDMTSAGAPFKVGSTDNWLGLDKNEIASYGDTLYIQKDSGRDVQMGDASNTSNLQVHGHLKANTIGKFYTTSSVSVSVPANGTADITRNCDNENDIIISCYYHGYSNKIYVYKMQPTEGDPMDFCFVSAKNTDVSARSISIKARCFDPDGE